MSNSGNGSTNTSSSGSTSNSSSGSRSISSSGDTGNSSRGSMSVCSERKPQAHYYMTVASASYVNGSLRGNHRTSFIGPEGEDRQAASFASGAAKEAASGGVPRQITMGF
ncbi:sericin-2-like [Penaeus indicus]|uniref:sericin-2-like n=1 Tax=Penaeus indicus TaxID=29960 RepID=UPI00300CE3B8